MQCRGSGRSCGPGRPAMLSAHAERRSVRGAGNECQRTWGSALREAGELAAPHSLTAILLGSAKHGRAQQLM
eukprot:366345-Chlamydomonas_euryale.AAC.7